MSALLLQREAAKPANAALSGAQRLMGARVYVQGVVVLTTAVVLALSEVVEACATSTASTAVRVGAGPADVGVQSGGAT